MEITHLGHAGFLVETDDAVVVMDPWLSASGGIDSSWFQYPRNHHLADFVRERLRDDSKERYVYVSHEHKDHFDPEFLQSLEPGFTYVVPRFRRDALRRALSAWFPCREVVALGDGEAHELPGGSVKLFLADGELNRDSAILLSLGGRVFLNVNDCKIHDRMKSIAESDGPVDVFTAQFSGATFHPTCYDYSRERHVAIARRKIMGKFETVAQAIEDTACRIYVPSAGPPCFLEPEYLERNFDSGSIYRLVPEFFRFLDRRLADRDVARAHMMPGDVLDVATGALDERGGPRVDDGDVEAYIRDYAADYDAYFAERRRASERWDPREVFDGMREELSRKLKGLTLRERVPFPFYFEVLDLPGPLLEIDFRTNGVAEVTERRPGDYYYLGSYSWDIGKILTGEVSWEDYMGTFRARLSRDPDVYNTLLAGFLLVEAEDLPAFCEKQLEVESRRDRIVVEADGARYEVDRFCPHQAGDLANAAIEKGRYLVCARHHWRFDLENGGACVGNAGTVNARKVE